MHNIVDKFQSAFCQGHSTETALTRVVNDLTIATDAGNEAVLMFLACSICFDMVNHSILLHRLEVDVGLRGTAKSQAKSVVPQ